VPKKPASEKAKAGHDFNVLAEFSTSHSHQ
jgi:hypothetical protein